MECLHFAIFIFLCILEVCIASDLEPWAGSQLGTTNYNRELAAIELAKLDYQAALNASLTQPRKELLCVSFLGLNPNSTLVMHRNIGYSRQMCDWSVLLYAGTKGEVRSICNVANSTFGNVVLCERVKESHISEKLRKSIPKSVQYQSLLPVLPLYNRVMLMDEDISIKDLNFEAFLRIWDCAFEQRPLIVQPLIAENNQYIPYVNEAPWRTEAFQDVIASTVGYVEQQVPAFDSIFFEWYVRRVLIQVKELALQYGMDWGHDRSWCNAAALYAESVLGWPRTGFNNTVAAPCALLTSRSTIAHHLNHHTMKIIQGRLKLLRRAAFIVVQRYVDHFPTWVGMDLIDSYNPLNATNVEKYQQVRRMEDTCTAWTGSGYRLRPRPS